MTNLHWPHRSNLRSARSKRRRKRARMDQALAEAERALVLSHGHCLDGTGSVIAALRALGENGIGVAYCQPNNVAGMLKMIAEEPGRDRTLYVADLSLNQHQFPSIVDACRRLHSKGWRIEWRDHHHKQWEGIDLEKLRRHVAVLEVNDDFTESGASMMQKALCPDDDMCGRLADTIRDRDLWRNEIPDSETLEFAINEMGTDPFIRHYLDAPADAAVVDETIHDAARAHRRRIRDHTDRLLKDAQYGTTADGDRVCVVYGWLPKNVGLHRALDQDDVLVAANVRPNGKMSMRSREGAGICHLICREFDGGGHPNASGADLGLSGLSYAWYVLRRGRVKRVQEVMEAALRHLEAHDPEE